MDDEKEDSWVKQQRDCGDQAERRKIDKWQPLHRLGTRLELNQNNVPIENVRICYSPFPRTTHTAKVVAAVLNLPFDGPQCKVMEDLRECYFGPTFELMSHDKYPEIWALDEKDPLMGLEGGESVNGVASRLAVAMATMESEFQGCSILVVSHGEDTIDIAHPVDEEDMDDIPFPASGDFYLPEGDLLDLEPYEGMEFESEEAAKAFYNSYARRVGFSTRVSSSRRSRRDGAIIQRQFVCAKEGFRNLNEKRTKDREIKRPRTITRVGCKASLSVKMQDSGKWLVGTLTFMASKAEDDGEVIAYQVAKYGEDHKTYYVKFNVLEMKASCSCQMFEFSGLLCRHVLAVFRVTNVLTLPPHYILKRWTRNAKSSVTLEDRANDVYTGYLESHTVRYNTLRYEAFKFVDEGATSLDTYNVAMASLQEAAKRVALAATKNESRTTIVNGHIRGNLASDANRANSTSANHQGNSSQPLSEDDMDKRIRELTSELDSASRKCEAYRANLLSLLKHHEDHSLQEYCWVGNVDTDVKNDCNINNSQRTLLEYFGGHLLLVKLEMDARRCVRDENDCWLENINHRSKSTYYFERHGRSEAKAVREGAKFKA
ncbi:hypothetical protein JRO89_XS05G0015100 [Xanthoceras sorbifolium]|uniref:Protein FAR1-RELATED SEQUENCE n=1 Tax=Xanthoceras sorbifolium TaxID=99658 RepID=A0ABQ8HZX1_9ROSI|nr:hypothetical protein JRO89_XS05G0015100 [Xanthoceras sorbifolium]